MLVPPGVVTSMSTVPALSAGETAVMLVAEFTVKLVAGVLPKLTAVEVKLVPLKPFPVIVTEVPPAVVPLDGPMAVTAGIGA
jgi:hypothetical protein